MQLLTALTDVMDTEAVETTTSVLATTEWTGSPHGLALIALLEHALSKYFVNLSICQQHVSK